MRRAVFALLATGCVPELPVLDDPCGAWPEPGVYLEKVDTADRGVRKVSVYVPASDGPRDVVFVLHGQGMNGQKMVDVTEYLDAADAKGFVVVYPDALGWPLRTWNAGPDFGGPDDVAFLDEAAQQVSDKVCGRRLLATGFSNGAMMGHRWACEGTEVDVLGVSSGPLMVDRCDGPPIPVRDYHGTEDPIVPPEGGSGTTIGNHDFPSIDDTMAIWRERNQCTDDDPDVTTRGDTTCTAWHCAAETQKCMVKGWGHMWPGGIHASATDADATGALLDFLDEADPLQPEDVRRGE